MPLISLVDASDLQHRYDRLHAAIELIARNVRDAQALDPRGSVAVHLDATRNLLNELGAEGLLALPGALTRSDSPSASGVFEVIHECEPSGVLKADLEYLARQVAR